MMEALDSDLKKDGYPTLIFDAWKYRHERNLILPLICALERKYLSDQGVKDSAKKVVATAAVVVMAHQLLKKKFGIDLGEVKVALELSEDGYAHYKKYDDSVAALEKEYGDFIEKLLNVIEVKQESAKQKPLVVFIDNLDRCLPDIVVNLLEDISSFLSIRGVRCVYVLAMDKNHIINAINHRFPKFDGIHYLEKIVHIPLAMPLPQKREDHESSYGLFSFMRQYEYVKKYTKESSGGDKRDSVWKALQPFDRAFTDAAFLGNPRRVKRFVNKLAVLECMGLFNVERDPDSVPAAIFLLLLAEKFSNVYGCLKDDSAWQQLESVLSMSVQPESQPSRLRASAGALRPKNEKIFDLYLNNSDFYDFLKIFSGLGKQGNLQQVLKDVNACLSWIG